MTAGGYEARPKAWSRHSTSPLARTPLAHNTNSGAGAYPANPSSTFGQVTAVADPRALHLAVRVRFYTGVTCNRQAQEVHGSLMQESGVANLLYELMSSAGATR